MGSAGALAIGHRRMSKPQLLSALNMLALMVHQYEEYEDPGYFPARLLQPRTMRKLAAPKASLRSASHAAPLPVHWGNDLPARHLIGITRSPALPTRAPPGEADDPPAERSGDAILSHWVWAEMALWRRDLVAQRLGGLFDGCDRDLRCGG
jgi:hypothetical protein